MIILVYFITVFETVA